MEKIPTARLDRIHMPRRILTYHEHMEAGMRLSDVEGADMRAARSNMLAYREYQDAANKAPDKETRIDAERRAYLAAFRAGESAYYAADESLVRENREETKKRLEESKRCFALAYGYAVTHLGPSYRMEAEIRLDSISWIIREFR